MNKILLTIGIAIGIILLLGVSIFAFGKQQTEIQNLKNNMIDIQTKQQNQFSTNAEDSGNILSLSAKQDQNILNPLTSINPRFSATNITGSEMFYADHQGNGGLLNNFTIGGYFFGNGSNIKSVCLSNGTSCPTFLPANDSLLWAGHDWSEVSLWLYNQTYSGSTYNVSYNSWLGNYTEYNKWWYNQTLNINSNLTIKNIIASIGNFTTIYMTNGVHVNNSGDGFILDATPSYQAFWIGRFDYGSNPGGTGLLLNKTTGTENGLLFKYLGATLWKTDFFGDVYQKGRLIMDGDLFKINKGDLDVNGTGTFRTEVIVNGESVSQWLYNQTNGNGSTVYIPYTGAINNINLGSHNLTTLGNVGIGTTTPAQTLNVVGNANVTGTMFAHNYSSNSPIQFVDTQTGELLMSITKNKTQVNSQIVVDSLIVNGSTTLLGTVKGHSPLKIIDSIQFINNSDNNLFSVYTAGNNITGSNVSSNYFGTIIHQIETHTNPSGIEECWWDREDQEMRMCLDKVKIEMWNSLLIHKNATIEGSLNINSLISSGNKGITNTTGYWLCKDDKCKTTCQVKIINGVITGCN